MIAIMTTMTTPIMLLAIMIIFVNSLHLGYRDHECVLRSCVFVDSLHQGYHDHESVLRSCVFVFVFAYLQTLSTGDIVITKVFFPEGQAPGSQVRLRLYL